MQTIIPVQNTIFVTGEVIATDVNYEDFLRNYNGQHVEWIDGTVIKMPTVGTQHNRLTRFFLRLFEDYLALSEIGGEVFHDPMVMKPGAALPGRAPDICIVLPEHRSFIKENQIDGPADIVVEIVSPDSQRQDRIEKYAEYEKGGVREYWIIDPTRNEALFYQRNELGIYELAAPDQIGLYHSRVLSRLYFEIALLWQEFPPSGPEITRLVEAMLSQS
jgi:Uma2 family endonuclease